MEFKALCQQVAFLEFSKLLGFSDFKTIGIAEEHIKILMLKTISV
jgi:hypothetical protein